MRSTSFVYVLSCLFGIPDIIDATYFSVRYLVSHMFDMCEVWKLIIVQVILCGQREQRDAYMLNEG